MINIKCIETGDVYQLSGDDESFNVKIYSDLAAALDGIMKQGTFIKMHQKDLEYRIALAKLTGFTYVFHAHVRAVKRNQVSKHSTHVSHSLLRLSKSFYEEYARRRNEERFQNPIIFSDVP
ncbi:MAG: hypothetical protein KIG60_01135 [Caryophanon sp.]|nr:hypothetical protein [Caryophanon sp.]